MPIETILLPEDSVILAVFTGVVTGAELQAWRLGLSLSQEVRHWHLVYDTLDYDSTLDDGDLAGLMGRFQEPPTERVTIVVSRDPMMGLCMKSVAARAGGTVPGRRFAVAASRAEALARLRAAAPT